MQDLQELEDGKWTALIQGTEVYEVYMCISGDTVTEYKCTCPYDLGPICKHQVATIYAIEDCLSEATVVDIKEGPNQRQKKRSKGKTGKQGRKTIIQKVEEALENMSQEEIIDLVRSYSLQNREFRNIILARFTPHSEEEGKSTYRQLIKESLRSGMDHHGFIDYWGAGRAVRGAEELLDKGEKLVENGKPEQAIPIFKAVIEELVPALQNADDSSGSIGSAIEYSFQVFYKCIEKVQDTTSRKDLFDYCLTESNRKQYDGWDWQWDFLGIAGKLISTEEQEKQLFSKLDKMSHLEQSSEFTIQYCQERAAEIKLEVIKKRGRQQEIDRFMNDNLHHTSIRRQAIEQAFANKDFSRVKKLATQGIEQDTERRHPGLVIEWLNWLLKLAEKEENVEDIREYSRVLFFQTGDFAYYDKFKKTYSKSIWADQFMKLLRHLEQSKNLRGVHSGTLAEIFIREKEWQKLLELVRKHPSFEILDQYHKHLAPHFPQELIQMYEKTSKELLVHTTGRATYEDVCRMLRRMKKLGAGDRVKELIKEFSEQYKNRRALLEELEKV
ncbi:MAG: hypothetical protein HYW01_08320 [Deltaproteobacteria bacterium]|nr:hypothetical protein [Deltaproteobacteria bacterium]